MRKEKVKERYETFLSPYTLKFHDPEEEAIFQEKYDSNLRMPLIFRITTYVAITYLFVLRIFKLYATVNKVEATSGSFEGELVAFLITLISFLVDGLLTLFGWLKQYRGFLTYTCFSIVVVQTAFSTRNAPIFGIQYLYKF